VYILTKLRKLQLIELKILKEFIRICEIYELCYYVCGGTCLGAVRHGGFIPWDDDIDVAMPREDYNKFLEIAPEVISKDFIVSTFDTFPVDNLVSTFSFIKFFYANKDLIIESKNAVVANRMYCGIDIFPIDGLPNFKLRRVFHTRLFLVRRMLYQFSVFKENVDQRDIGRPWYEKLIILFCNKFNIERLFDRKKRFIAADNMLGKYSFYKQKWCCILWGRYKLKDIFPTDFWGKGVKLKFEDIEVTAPQNYDSYLKSIYGEYMALPPVEQRNRHEIEIISEEEK
jgi:lipopolysaccharide cholinephosphotransferase